MAFGLGADVVLLPGRSRAAHHCQHLLGGLGHPRARRALWTAAGAAQDAVQIRTQSLFAAQRGQRLRPPVGALLGVGARLVLGLAGLQVGPLGQGHRLDRGRWAAVVGLELPRERRAADVDSPPS